MQSTYTNLLLQIIKLQIHIMISEIRREYGNQPFFSNYDSYFWYKPLIIDKKLITVDFIYLNLLWQVIYLYIFYF